MEDVKLMLAEAKEMHEKFYGDQDYDYESIPMYFLYRGTQVHTIVAIPDVPRDGGAKQRLVLDVRKRALEAECDGFAWNMEAWTIPPEAVKEHMAGGGPEGWFQDRPDRIEILTVEVGNRRGDSGVQVAHITRTPGQPPQLQWQQAMFTDDSGVKLQSRFNIFNPQNPNLKHETTRLSDQTA